MIVTSEKSTSLWLNLLVRALFGLPVGFTIALLSLFGTQTGVWLLGKVLRSDLIGLIVFGTYFQMLGIAGIASLYSDVDAMKKLINIVSIPKWMSFIAGILVGISIAALCKNSDLSAIGFLFWPFGLLVWHIYLGRLNIRCYLVPLAARRKPSVRWRCCQLYRSLLVLVRCVGHGI